MEITFRTLRLKAGLTCEEVANRLGVKETTQRKYECSDRIPSNSKLIKLEKILKCNNNEFMSAYAFHKQENLYRAKKKGSR